MGRENIHNNLVDRLQSVLFNSRDYDNMWKFFEYCRNGVCGEVDLLAVADRLYDFYEVKCNRHSKSLRKAQEQFDRYKRTFPEQDVRGFFYAGRDIEPLR